MLVFAQGGSVLLASSPLQYFAAAAEQPGPTAPLLASLPCLTVMTPVPECAVHVLAPCAGPTDAASCARLARLLAFLECEQVAACLDGRDLGAQLARAMADTGPGTGPRARERVEVLQVLPEFYGLCDDGGVLLLSANAVHLGAVPASAVPTRVVHCGKHRYVLPCAQPPRPPPSGLTRLLEELRRGPAAGQSPAVAEVPSARYFAWVPTRRAWVVFTRRAALALGPGPVPLPFAAFHVHCVMQCPAASLALHQAGGVVVYPQATRSAPSGEVHVLDFSEFYRFLAVTYDAAFSASRDPPPDASFVGPMTERQLRAACSFVVP